MILALRTENDRRTIEEVSNNHRRMIEEPSKKEYNKEGGHSGHNICPQNTQVHYQESAIKRSFFILSNKQKVVSII